MSRLQQEEIETILYLIRAKQAELKQELEILEESILKEHSCISVKPSENKIEGLIRLLKVLEELE